MRVDRSPTQSSRGAAQVEARSSKNEQASSVLPPAGSTAIHGEAAPGSHDAARVANFIARTGRPWTGPTLARG